MADFVAEMMFGEGTVRIRACRMVIRGADRIDTNAGGVDRHGFWGVFALPADSGLLHERNNGHWEMWDCEVYIVPKSKHHGVSADGQMTAFGGYRADQMLTEGFADCDRWCGQYWPVEEAGR